MFTAATIVSMTENEERFSKGINTPLSSFMDSLKTKYSNNVDAFKYIEEYYNYSQITIKHLLQHTHGLPDITPMCFNDILSQPEKIWGAADGLKKEYFEADTTKSKFGTHKYSNSGYYLLGAIIEAESGKSYAGMVKELVIDKLDLKHTYTYENTLPDDSVGYSYRNNNGKADLDRTDRFTYAAGMIRATPSDITTFTEEFFAEENNHLFSPNLVKLIKDTPLVDRGYGVEYGYGLGFKVFTDGTKGHDGASWGFNTEIKYNTKTGKAEFSETRTTTKEQAEQSPIIPESVSKTKQAILDQLTPKASQEAKEIKEKMSSITNTSDSTAKETFIGKSNSPNNQGVDFYK
jgi:hypothetical protein